jgi:hypothetical protein
MGFSVVHWLILCMALCIWVIPAVKIVQKAGYSGWWVVPLVNIIMLWVFAFADWPSLARRTEPPPIGGA